MKALIPHCNIGFSNDSSPKKNRENRIERSKRKVCTDGQEGNIHSSARAKLALYEYLRGKKSKNHHVMCVCTNQEC